MNPKEWLVTHFVLFLLLLETNEHCKQQKYRHLQRNPHFMASDRGRSKNEGFRPSSEPQHGKMKNFRKF